MELAEARALQTCQLWDSSGLHRASSLAPRARRVGRDIPEVVVVLIGGNNVFYFTDETPEWTARGIEKIVAVIQKRSPASKVLLFGIFPRDEKDSRARRTITAVNQEIQRLDDGTHVRFADIGAQFLDGEGNIPADIMPDQVHLSAKGYAIWYRSLESILPAMFK